MQRKALNLRLMVMNKENEVSPREEAEERLRISIINGIKELNQITGMSVCGLNIYLTNAQQISWKKADYVVGNIRITYE